MGAKPAVPGHAAHCKGRDGNGSPPEGKVVHSARVVQDSCVFRGGLQRFFSHSLRIESHLKVHGNVGAPPDDEKVARGNPGAAEGHTKKGVANA